MVTSENDKTDLYFHCRQLLWYIEILTIFFVNISYLYMVIAFNYALFLHVICCIGSSSHWGRAGQKVFFKTIRLGNMATTNKNSYLPMLYLERICLNPIFWEIFAGYMVTCRCWGIFQDLECVLILCDKCPKNVWDWLKLLQLNYMWK